MPHQDQPTDPPPSRLRRWGPIAAVAVLAVAAVAVAVGTSGTGADEPAGSETSAAPGGLPDGVVTWSMAQEGDLDATFPDTCDTESGRVAIPFFFRTECLADAAGNGGATAPGVTAGTVKVVAWLPSDDDPIYSIVRQGLGFDDSAEQMQQTYEGLAEIFGTYYQTYGRTVELEFVQASGSILDPVAARADAVRAAEMEPFAVIGGPLLGIEWTEELHARGIVCLACPTIEEPAPTAFGILAHPSQTREHVVAYVTEKLAGKPAEFAGEGTVGQDRVFAMLTLAQSELGEAEVARYEEDFADAGVELVENISYELDVTRTQELATSAITRMKEAGVTTVIVSTDPITLPTYLTEATKQNWYPEWVLAAPTFVDTSNFARDFDQAQWEHAFGLSFLPPNSQPEITPPYQLYEWYFGEAPPADESLLLTYPQVVLLFTGLGYAGPELTAETFRDGLFAFPPTPRAVTQPSLDYGTELWGEPDYGGIDDLVEIWWDPDAEGIDEQGEAGVGMYRYVDGGRRYLPDEYTDELRMFDPEGAVTEIADPPDAEIPPDYPSPAAAG